MDLSGFANPWEHIRLLSDGGRNDALIELLVRHAPGRRVLEVGCGTGLLSLVAARLGASYVYAVEPTSLVDLARQLVEDNQLTGVIEVLAGRVQDLAPQPVDLAFSELLNADPFTEQVVPAMQGAARWVVPGGLLAPSRLRVWVALAPSLTSVKEARWARGEVSELADRYDLRLDGLIEALTPDEAYKYHASNEEPVSTVALAWDLALGTEQEPEDSFEIELTATEAGQVGGALVWFEATLDEDLAMDNRPGEASHWGQLICGWSEAVDVEEGERVTLHVELDGDEVEVTLG